MISLIRLRPLAPFAWRTFSKSEYGASPDLEGYRTLKEATGKFEIEVKKSKFVSQGWPVQDSSEAQKLIRENSDPKASHNCYAYKIGYEYKFSDDGEPGGTGGRPIYSSIEADDLDRVCVLVTRYFGGTKLGTGPLGRSYGEAARKCLESAEKVEIRPMVDGEVTLTYGSIFQLDSILRKSFNGKIMSKIPTHSGLCTVTFRVEEQYFDDVREYLEQLASRKITVRIKNKTKLY